MTIEQPSRETLCGAPITTRLDEDVDHIAVLVDGPPEILTLALDVDEELVQVPRIAQPTFPPLQCMGVFPDGSGSGCTARCVRDRGRRSKSVWPVVLLS